MARVWLASRLSKRTAAFFIAKFNRPDLDVIRELLESGQIRPVVEQRYELSQSADALRYLGEGHARGKIVVSV
jgi:NADPH:quinone reductase-like Zn-dependent oxidoreductase